MTAERLQKLIAQAGLTSRRQAEEWIQRGRVRVNGRIVNELGARADLSCDRVEVDGQRLVLPRAWTYLLLNKPAKVVTTASDEFGRRNVLDLVKGVEARVYPVGRLDFDAEGALLLTNDGELAAALTHPAGRVEKVYRCKVQGQPTEDTLTRLLTGVILEDGEAKALSAQAVTPGRRRSEQYTWVEITVTEGRNHLVKRMFEAVGHPVVRLKRVAFAGLSLDRLKEGESRPLKKDELRSLRALARVARRRRGQPDLPDPDDDQ